VITSIFPLAGTVLALPNPHSTDQSRYVSFSNYNMLLDRGSETQVISFGLTLKPSGVGCDASKSNFASPESKCVIAGIHFHLMRLPSFTVGTRFVFLTWLKKGM